jgi:hypothetical protein
VKASFTMNMHRMVRLLTKSTTLKLSVSCVLRCGATYLCHGSCTMKMPQPTHPNLFRPAELNIGSHKCHSPLFTRHVPAWPFLFQKVKMQLKGNKFQDMDEIKCNIMTQPLAVPKSQFQKCFRLWKDCWNKYVVCEGDYFEGGLDCILMS